MARGVRGRGKNLIVFGGQKPFELEVISENGCKFNRRKLISMGIKSHQNSKNFYSLDVWPDQMENINATSKTYSMIDGVMENSNEK